MITRFLFHCAALLLFTGIALAEGKYQLTRDDKTTVWNNNPKAGESAAWNGDRDSDGYATGFGTLTWYTASSNIYARFYGHMVRGKFDGQVNVHTKGKTGHAVFTDGKRSSRWATGPAPSRKGATKRSEPAKTEIEKVEGPAPEMVAEGKTKEVPPPMAETPIAETPIKDPVKATEVQKSAEPVVASGGFGGGEPATSSVEHPPAHTPASGLVGFKEASGSKPKPEQSAPPAVVETKDEVDESVGLVMQPPSSLRTPSAGDASAASPSPDETSRLNEGALLTKENVIELADGAARTAGYDLAQYSRPKAEYNASNGTWLLPYDRKLPEGLQENVEHFSVTVDDKTRKTEIHGK